MLKGRNMDGNNAGKAADKWNQAHAVANYRARFAMSHPVYSKFIYNSYLGGKRPIGILKQFLNDKPCEYAAELACGRGDLGINLLKAGIVKRLDGFDVSPVALEKAKEKMKTEGVANANFFVADVNEIRLRENTYDLIYFSQALHHIERLEHVYEEVNNALVKEGIFFVSDYVGPSYMQWTDQQLDLMNRILSLLPEKYREFINSGDGVWNGKLKAQIGRTSIDTYLRKDPSEGVRSSEIVPLARRYFDVVGYYPMGGTITYELLRGIVHHFDESDERDVAMLELICLFEHTLIQNGCIGSDFACFFARKKS